VRDETSVGLPIFSTPDEGRADVSRLLELLLEGDSSQIVQNVVSDFFPGLDIFWIVFVLA
jgi:hypothetical protein